MDGAVGEAALLGITEGMLLSSPPSNCLTLADAELLATVAVRYGRSSSCSALSGLICVNGLCGEICAPAVLM